MAYAQARACLAYRIAPSEWANLTALERTEFHHAAHDLNEEQRSHG